MIRLKSNGHIAIKWTLNRMPKPVKISGTNEYYVFVPKQNVFMSWVKPEHVAGLLAIREKHCNCQNGIWKQAFDYSNLLDVCLWMTNDRCVGDVFDWEEVPNS